MFATFIFNKVAVILTSKYFVSPLLLLEPTSASLRSKAYEQRISSIPLKCTETPPIRNRSRNPVRSMLL